MSSKCKVNWTHAVSPKACGGLRILHLKKFAKALHLRCLWQQWVFEDKTWLKNDVPCTSSDGHLLAVATTIKIGDGRQISFWNSAWLHEGKTFGRLWTEVVKVRLHPNVQDNIIWKLIESHHYSARSAYQAYPRGLLAPMTHSHAERPVIHLPLLERSPIAPPTCWWTAIARVPTSDKKGLRSLIMLIAWGLWRERNARIFDHRESSFQQVLGVVKDEAMAWLFCSFARSLQLLFCLLCLQS
ncbi:hypothetical protein BS78_05G115500 [Paspalum vaginatum]|nr:hypothetical protein BS78_05G115500 [Paspalum vaginatum]